eukprot:TRINITY_DN19315_c0_g1_i2.p1 TRINITY_DN19315_c0_g1~~TRINITY_DN19315_c0_g1_i2.p1  ORF type:complete len:260 (+),score=63.53 TRINITY_DN19315_c0_g1_i2:50-781(+)
MEAERRIDASNGEAYTKAEFVEFYGGTVEWDKSASARSASAAVATSQAQLPPAVDSAVSAGVLSALAARAAAALRKKRQTVVVVEATTGGLIHAALLACPGAGLFSAGGLSIYSQPAARALIPIGVQRKLGRPADNYSSPESYLRSKEVFVTTLADHFRSHFGASWCLVESGAADARRLPDRLQGVGSGFTALAVAGPGVKRHTLVRSKHNDREKNVWEWTQTALTFLAEAVEESSGGKVGKL